LITFRIGYQDMSINTFIFSEKRTDRIKRHIFFWIIWGLYFGMLHAANPFLKPAESYFRRTQFAYAETILQLIPQIIIAYLILNIVLPMYTREKKIIKPIFWGIVFWFACGYLNMWMILKFNPVFLEWILPAELLVNTQRLPEASRFMALLSTWKGALSGTAFLVGIHYIKQWYLKEQRNLQLMKENTEAQLQLLTAQVHPHFLFNTLNNIYSQSQIESPKSSKMIMELSDMLRYILYEGSKQLVPLAKELQMIMEYINLEKIRYGNKLDIHYLISDKTTDVFIAPLILLPFIENCFKHGASNMLENPWINLTIEVKDTTLVMKLMNGKAIMSNITQGKSGIGINNVRQRLELLYKDKYELQIREEEEIFVVDLKIILVKLEDSQSITIQSAPEILYV
jgi:Histidine kinase